MSRKRYTGAMQGSGGCLTAIKRAWASRFEKFRAIVMINKTGDKIELSVHYHALLDTDMISLKRKNWQTGAETTLFEGTIDDGTPPRQRHSRD